ncbi:MAG TPA: cobyrinate a,c-diamide synthase [Actinomycetota bacterium]|jgi:cobyrinic acid a,c-diamide synthase|nr:cobyrinate a,c-diamide synthase [Actinomycetota bacterium]
MSGRVVIAGTHSGVGKTTVATGLMAAFSARGVRVAPFKVGPDFIDPSYHRLAAGRPGRNLDPFLHGPELIEPLFAHGSAGADLAVVEGVMGLYDGAAAGGSFASTAHVAKLLHAPVVLVVDASSMSTSVAALVHGFAAYDPRVRIKGVILNRVGSDTHERMLKDALRPLGLPVLGVLRRRAAVSTPGRHLGLVPAAERAAEARRTVTALGKLIASSCDLKALAAIASSASSPRTSPWDPSSPSATRRVRVAVAGGPSFTFVYEENLELMRGRGAEIHFFDPASDQALPEADALCIGGGFPESYAQELESNVPMRAAVARFAASGRPLIAECGGLLYLCRTLDDRKMCGVIDADARMTERLTLGYRKARAAGDSVLARAGDEVHGHEFHYSVVEPRAGAAPAWVIRGRPEGFTKGSLHAGYLHLHWARFPQLADAFVQAAARRRVAA